ncbi:zinc ribbon domain-containing protein, partial [Streptomyces scabiei]|uniref:zinc ribbon domain-containing protein n=1 Tax=Streptomyces scabiei TaxID=1930 RepID=UPI0038F615AF
MRYRYYVSRALQSGTSQQGMRIPAREIEAAVAERIASEFDDVLTLLITTGLPLPARDIDEVQSRGSELAARLRRGKTPEL